MFVGTLGANSLPRVIPLPSEAKTEDVSASYENGILEITLPKVEPAKPKEFKIKVKEG